MGDFNIDCTSCINKKKWQNLVQLFDLSQLVSEPTRITETTSTLIDHIYTNNQENINVCLFVFVCFVALRPKSTAMVIAGRSVHLTTLFPGQA